jgi:hypothetical protein
MAIVGTIVLSTVANTLAKGDHCSDGRRISSTPSHPGQILLIRGQRHAKDTGSNFWTKVTVTRFRFGDIPELSAKAYPAEMPAPSLRASGISRFPKMVRATVTRTVRMIAPPIPASQPLTATNQQRRLSVKMHLSIPLQ